LTEKVWFQTQFFYQIVSLLIAGIITYILITGISPFLGANDRETLQNLQKGKIDLSNESLMDISEEGRDFLSKVLVFDPSGRIDVKTALQHPWLRLADRPGVGDQLNCIDNLRQYQKRWKSWVSFQISQIEFYYFN